jgi:Cu/Ag efflux protein CusF
MKLVHIFAAAALAISVGANAQSTPASGAEHSAHHAATAAAPQSDGEVRKIDTEQGKVTLRHGPLQNLDMPPMTMVFKAADPKLLEGLKEGDRVKFTAQKINGAFTVTAIQVAK